MQHVAVIGAGVSGLAAARYLLAAGCEVTIFERKAAARGVWNTATSSSNFFPSPIYDELQTNVPRTLMTFPNLPWPSNASLFPKHYAVKDYLQQYAATLKHATSETLAYNMRYNTEIIDLRKYDNLWNITARKHQFQRDSRVDKYCFSAVIVAIGNYEAKFVPKFTGLSA